MLERVRRYRVLQVVGRGAVGTVYRAEFLGEGGFRRQVALKRLRPDARGPDAASRLRDEARVLARVRHRAIVHVDDLVHLNGRWTVVMDYVDGVDLFRVLREHGAVPVGPALEIVREVAAALSTAWTAPDDAGRPLGILHRDLKPSNILVSAAGEVTVVDFGIARFGDGTAEREAWSGGATFGSLGYVAPERVDGIEEPAGDVFSLGVLLCELLTAEAFGRAIVPKLHRQATAQATRALTEARVPAAVRDLALEMVAYESDERPTARDVERRCRALLRGVSGDDLHDWAERTLPRLISRVREDLVDELVNETLVETTPLAELAGAAALPTFDALLTDEEEIRGEVERVEYLDPPDPTDTATLPSRSWAANAIHDPEPTDAIERSAPTPAPAPTASPPAARNQLTLAIAAAAVGGALISTAAAAVLGVALYLLYVV